jgi:cell division protein FtsW
VRRTLNLLAISVLALLAIGFTLLASASAVNGLRLHNNAYHFVIHQAVWLFLVAVPAMLVVTFFDYHRWRRNVWLTVALYVGICILLCAVFGFKEINGSHRWINLGPIRLQPSEFAKMATILSVGVFLDRAGWKIELFWKGAIPAVGIIGVLAVLTVAEPDFGSTMVLGLTGFVLLFIAGMKIAHILILGGLGFVAVLVRIASNANRMRRIVAWLPNEMAMKVMEMFNIPAVAQGELRPEAHQLNQALVAIQRGGLTGVGFNKSMQKQYYLPEAHTDFIFAIGAEEWGLIFSLVLLALFIVIFVCGVRIALRAPDRLGRLFAFGATFLVFFQALFNIGVVTGWMPTKGLALPFISYGGTNLVTAMAAIGLLFNVGRQIESSQMPRLRRSSSMV